MKKYNNFWQDAFYRLKSKRLAKISLYFLTFLATLSIVGPFLSSYGYADMDSSMHYKFWDWASLKRGHLLGADDFGRDILTRICYGGRISLAIALSSILIEGIIGVIYGSIAGYFGGKVDLVMSKFMEIITSVPNLIYVILLMILLGSNIFTIILAMSISRWMLMAMIVRSEVIKMKSQEFILASKTLGASPWWILYKHVLPNILGQVIVRLTVGIPVAIFYEAFLSFIGIGVPLPMASWGRMISEGIKELGKYPHIFIIPSLFLSVTILCFNLIGDALTEVLDPKLRR